ncbi:LOW QUALITY PROTEIN: aldehyde oxidase 3-like, partial [Gorilla gorilla gorilla]|uniref:LOW QUALITY PROTEIN: aldehyde oxidase 3-like n=1 Tax=Gorilla gorilla gorilla TaxID=9595 RepID=UPI002445EC29
TFHLEPCVVCFYEGIAKAHSPQCGFCTLEMVMTIYTVLRSHPELSTEQLMEILSGNLCCCTGQRPIVDSGKNFSLSSFCCQMNGEGKCCLDQEKSPPERRNSICTKSYKKEECQPVDPTQELAISASHQQNALAVMNAGMTVLFKDGTNTIVDFSVYMEEVALLQSVQINSVSSLSEASLLQNPGGYPDISKKLLSVLTDVLLTLPQGMYSYECVDSQKPLSQDPSGMPIMPQVDIKHAMREAVFCDDMPALAEELFLTVVTSTRPHAKIISTDASEALALPGVVDAITVQDVPGNNCSEEERLYAQEEAICVGQIFCTVAADKHDHAKQATKAVKIVYQDVEPIIVNIRLLLPHQSSLAPSPGGSPIFTFLMLD